MKFKKIAIIGCIIALAYILLIRDEHFVPVESVDLLSGISVDLMNDSEEKKYFVAYSRYVYMDTGEISNIVVGGESSTLGNSREERQRKTNQKHLATLQKVMLLGEEFAKDGIGQYINVIFQNPLQNDMAHLAVCKGKGVDILKYNIKGFSSSADYIEGLIKNSINGNFFSDNYKVIDTFVRTDTEGRSLTLPYIEIREGTIEISGLAVFKRDKMALRVDMDEARVLNILRENNAFGILTLKKNSDECVDIYAKTKRKVGVKRNKEGYSFKIDIKIEAKLIDNSLYKNIINDPNVKDRFEKDMEAHVEKMSMEFINKMQKEYKLDCLDLGFNAFAKYGDGNKLDWDEIVSNSNIEVNVDVKLVNTGRGNF